MKESRRRYIEDILSRGGGMVTCGEHLGVMVGSVDSRVPPGWVFVPVETATVDLVSEAMDVAYAGRKLWPEKP